MIVTLMLRFLLVTYLLSYCGLAICEDLLEQDEVYDDTSLLAEESLLLSDEFELGEDSHERPGSSSAMLIDIFSVSVTRELAYGRHVEQSNIGMRLELDTPLWSGAYARIDYEVTHFFSPENLSRDYGEPYTNSELNEAWLQVSFSDCVAKLGRQTLFWGRVEGANALDVISPVDFTKPLLTDFSDIRLSSEMALFRCYQNDLTAELFYQEDALLNRFSHFESELERIARSGMGDEWGGRLSLAKQAFDLSLSYARLYANHFSILIDRNTFQSTPYSQRYELYGLSLGINQGSIMYELDLAYKTNQLSSVYALSGRPENLENRLEIALGFEYLSAANHQVNAGVWRFKSLEQDTNRTIYNEIWNVSWSKEYFNDVLGLSVLGAWSTVSELFVLNLASEYDFNDYVQLSLALSYASKSGSNDPVYPDSKLSSTFKIEAQF